MNIVDVLAILMEKLSPDLCFIAEQLESHFLCHSNILIYLRHWIIVFQSVSILQNLCLPFSGHNHANHLR